MRVLIAGCGYAGVPLGIELIRQGHEVWGMRRSEAGALEGTGIHPLKADVTKPADLAGLPGPFDWVVNTVASGGGGIPRYREVYLEGTRNLVAWLGPQRIKKYVHAGSTSVYGQTDGLAVKESSPTEPTTGTGKILVETERLLLGAFERERFPCVLLRLAGIYGPGRGRLFQQFLKDEARIPGHGLRPINMIHLDDVTGILLAALQHGRPGEIYNAVDDEPVAEVHFYRWLSETLGKWMPPFVAEEAVPAGKRGATRKKVSNRKLKMELGYRFKHPTFRQGYTAEILRLQQVGELNIQPEAR